MATLISIATGNLTSASTWGLVDSTSLLDSEAGSQTLTTLFSDSRSTAFTPGAITIDGIAVKLRDRLGTTGTISVHLNTSADHVEVPGTLATINTADLPSAASGTNEGGWIFFKFASPVTLSAATGYELEAKTSSSSMVNLHRDGTAGNCSRLLRTTTTQAPAAGDQLHIMGEHTGPGTGNDFTVTNDLTAPTDFGSGTDGSVALTISKRGTLSYGVAAATNYYLKLSGNAIVYNGGTFNIGTVGGEIPRDSTAVLEFDPVADGGMGLNVRSGGTFNAQGLSRTSGKNIYYCKLNTDEAINSTSLGVDTDTGWLDNDEIVVASTTRTASQSEKGTLNGNAGASTLTVDGFGGAGGGLAYAHSGTSPTQAEIILLTRNVKIRGVSASIPSFVAVGAIGGATESTNINIDVDWVEFYNIGENTNGKEGIYIGGVTGQSINFSYCSIHDTEEWGVRIQGSRFMNNVTFDKNVLWNLNTAGTAALNGFHIGNHTSASNVNITNNILIKTTGSTTDGFRCSLNIDPATPVNYNFTGNTVVSSSRHGISVSTPSTPSSFVGSFSDNNSHSNTSDGINILVSITATDVKNVITISGGSIWRNSGDGIEITPATTGQIILDGITLFGNTTNNINCLNLTSTNLVFNGLVLKNIISNGDSSFPTTNGLNFVASSTIIGVTLLGCNFSTAGGIKTAHTTDINFDTPLQVQILLVNTILAATTEMDSITAAHVNSFVKSTKHDQTAGTYKTWLKYGIITSDAVANMYRTAPPSMRLTPNNASNKLESGSFKVNVNSGQTCTPHVYVRESVVGDGADYNGNRPRLILKRNDAIGITSDTVIDTATVSAEGAFEELTGTTAAANDDGVMEFIIDCDGTTGWVNVDDFSATVA